MLYEDIFIRFGALKKILIDLELFFDVETLTTFASIYDTLFKAK